MHRKFRQEDIDCKYLTESKYKHEAKIKVISLAKPYCKKL